MRKKLTSELCLCILCTEQDAGSSSLNPSRSDSRSRFPVMLPLVCRRSPEGPGRRRKTWSWSQRRHLWSMFSEKSLVIVLLYCPLVAENHTLLDRNLKYLLVSIYVRHLYVKVSDIQEETHLMKAHSRFLPGCWGTANSWWSRLLGMFWLASGTEWYPAEDTL